jgi:DNA invertase Pin-like site-specific DNA recombinase
VTRVTIEINNSDPWKTLDDLLGVEVAEAPETGLGPMAFYGRCSTEDNQDPETSLAWQLGNARKFIEPLGGTIDAQYFDIGQSRSVPWERRTQAGQLLSALKDSNRGWSAVVVGEGTRCWFGNQFSLIAPRFDAYNVDLWVPELGGKFDQRNPSHKMLMSVLGGMSESERQHVQARVRAAMDAQVLNEGRHQGGRAPYGYAVVDGGPHPNPSRAAEGFRLRILAIDDTAEVVRRIFAEYLDGKGDRAIAYSLNRDGIPCPSAHHPEQNRHRRADGWQGSTVRAILDNPRYTGYAIFGRYTRNETLLDPEDVAAGHVSRFRRSSPDRIVRSRQQAHPAIVSVEEFTQAQLMRRTRAAGGKRGIAKLERTRTQGTRPYLLRGMVRCAVCGRRMHGATVRQTEHYYRCLARTLAPGSPWLEDHPRTVNLRETAVLPPLNDWLARLFAPENVDKTVASLLDHQDQPGRKRATYESLKKRVTDAEARLRKFQDAIAAGVDPTALVAPINEAQTERAAAQAQLDNTPAPKAIKDGELYAMIDSLGDVGAALTARRPERLSSIYSKLGLEVQYHPGERSSIVTVAPRVVT